MAYTIVENAPKYQLSTDLDDVSTATSPQERRLDQSPKAKPDSHKKSDILPDSNVSSMTDKTGEAAPNDKLFTDIDAVSADTSPHECRFDQTPKAKPECQPNNSGRSKPKRSKKDEDVVTTTVKVVLLQKKFKIVDDKLAIAVIAIEEVQAIAEGIINRTKNARKLDLINPPRIREELVEEELSMEINETNVDEEPTMEDDETHAEEEPLMEDDENVSKDLSRF
ncbi:unnamed protein product [Cochlearia groenlandica]